MGLVAAYDGAVTYTRYWLRSPQQVPIDGLMKGWVEGSTGTEGIQQSDTESGPRWVSDGL